MIFPVGATSQSVQAFFCDDAGLALTGKVAADLPSCTYQKAGANAAVAITFADLSTLTTAWAASSTWGVKEIGNGWYRVDVADAVFSTATRVAIGGETTGKHLVFPMLDVQMVQADLRQAVGQTQTLDANNVLNVSTKYISGTLQTARDNGVKQPMTLAATDVTGNVPANVKAINSMTVPAEQLATVFVDSMSGSNGADLLSSTGECRYFFSTHATAYRMRVSFSSDSLYGSAFPDFFSTNNNSTLPSSVSLASAIAAIPTTTIWGNKSLALNPATLKVNDHTVADTTTGGVTLTGSQPNYAPAKAGDAMTLTAAYDAAKTAAQASELAKLFGESGAWTNGSNSTIIKATPWPAYIDADTVLLVTRTVGGAATWAGVVSEVRAGNGITGYPLVFTQPLPIVAGNSGTWQVLNTFGVSQMSIATGVVYGVDNLSIAGANVAGIADGSILVTTSNPAVSGLTGSTSITIRVENSSHTGLTGAAITVDSSGSIATPVGGVIVIHLAPGTYTIGVAPWAGSLFTDQTITVADGVPASYTFTGSSSTPSTPSVGYVTAWITMVNADGPLSGEVLSYQIIDTMGNYGADRRPKVSGPSAGNGYLELQLLQNTMYRIINRSGIGVTIDVSTSTPIALPKILGGLS